MPPARNIGALHFAFKRGVLIVQQGSTFNGEVDAAVGAIYHLENLDLANAAVVTGVARAIGLSLTTSWYASDRTNDRWVVTSPAAPDFGGTYDEIVAFVRGYYAACKRAQLALERLRSTVTGVFDTEAERL